VVTTTPPDRDLIHPGASANCRDCGGTGVAIGREHDLAVARPCGCVERCPQCKGTEFVAVAETLRAARRRCVCQAVLSRMKAFDLVGIPARHADSTRMNFVVNSKHQTGVLQAVTKYLNDYDRDRENRGLVFTGEVGRGKTHLLVALVRELVFRKGVSARFVEFSHLLADLKAGFDTGRGAAELLEPLVRVDVLAIDELGKGRNTDFESTVVDELVSRRYNAMRPLLATTNYPAERATGRAVANMADVQVGNSGLPSLVDRIGDRVFSRLRETCDFVEVKGDDFREQRRRTRTGPARTT
jgi:DNA replication protein DnaC